MRVVCRKIVAGDQEVETHPSITIGRSYVVIALTCHPGDCPAVVITGDRNYPGQWPAEMFLTDDMSIPSNWTAHIQATGHVNIAPAAWLGPDFWDHFEGEGGATLEEERRAREDYRRELAIVLAEDAASGASGPRCFGGDEGT